MRYSLQSLPPHSETPINLHRFEEAIRHVFIHNHKRCQRYWLARSREDRDAVLRPLVGLVFKTAGGKVSITELTKILMSRLEGMRP